jgi:hypothetical protein
VPIGSDDQDDFRVRQPNNGAEKSSFVLRKSSTSLATGPSVPNSDSSLVLSVLEILKAGPVSGEVRPRKHQ